MSITHRRRASTNVVRLHRPKRRKSSARRLLLVTAILLLAALVMVGRISRQLRRMPFSRRHRISLAPGPGREPANEIAEEEVKFWFKAGFANPP
jgi:hypothetical protein